MPSTENSLEVKSDIEVKKQPAWSG